MVRLLFNNVSRTVALIFGTAGLATDTGLLAATSGSGLIPNDQEFSTQWNLERIDAPGAWTITTGSSNVVIAIIDNGVQITHPDLAANLWRNPGETGLDANGQDKATNGIDDDGNGYIDDVHGIDTGENDSNPSPEPGLRDTNRGTLCAGVIGAVGDNEMGVAGLNWQVQLMAIKAFRAPPNDPALLTDFVPLVADLTDAFRYVVDMKRRGVNVRAICNAYAQFPSPAWQDAVTAASDAGIMFVLNWSPVNTPVVQPQITSISFRDGSVAIEFSGVLQSADQISGPWRDVLAAPSPFIAPVQDGLRFWRTRAP